MRSCVGESGHSWPRCFPLTFELPISRPPENTVEHRPWRPMELANSGCDLDQMGASSSVMPSVDRARRTRVIRVVQASLSALVLVAIFEDALFSILVARLAS